MASEKVYRLCMALMSAKPLDQCLGRCGRNGQNTFPSEFSHSSRQEQLVHIS